MELVSNEGEIRIEHEGRPGVRPPVRRHRRQRPREEETTRKIRKDEKEKKQAAV